MTPEYHVPTPRAAAPAADFDFVVFVQPERFSLQRILAAVRTLLDSNDCRVRHLATHGPRYLQDVRVRVVPAINVHFV